jgi:CHAT domain-containing protein
MTRFYENWLGERERLAKPMSKAAALSEAKSWLRRLTREQAGEQLKSLSRGEIIKTTELPVATHPFEHPHFWAAFVLVGDPS